MMSRRELEGVSELMSKYRLPADIALKIHDYDNLMQRPLSVRVMNSITHLAGTAAQGAYSLMPKFVHKFFFKRRVTRCIKGKSNESILDLMHISQDKSEPHKSREIISNEKQLRMMGLLGRCSTSQPILVNMKYVFDVDKDSLQMAIADPAPAFLSRKENGKYAVPSKRDIISQNDNDCVCVPQGVFDEKVLETLRKGSKKSPLEVAVKSSFSSHKEVSAELNRILVPSEPMPSDIHWTRID